MILIFLSLIFRGIVNLMPETYVGPQSGATVQRKDVNSDVVTHDAGKIISVVYMRIV